LSGGDEKERVDFAVFERFDGFLWSKRSKLGVRCVDAVELQKRRGKCLGAASRRTRRDASTSQASQAVDGVAAVEKPKWNVEQASERDELGGLVCLCGTCLHEGDVDIRVRVGQQL